jgi:Uri superfamily endonuclease
MLRTERLPAQGTYTLAISVFKQLQVEVGRLGVGNFPKGHYTYTGSALGSHSSSLRGRVVRHLRRKKPLHWHIDYLLDSVNVRIAAVVAAPTERRFECPINQSLKTREKAETPIKGFGASDCQEDCASHLVFFPLVTENCVLVERISKHYRRFGLYPMAVSLTSGSDLNERAGTDRCRERGRGTLTASSHCF